MMSPLAAAVLSFALWTGAAPVSSPLPEQAARAGSGGLCTVRNVWVYDRWQRRMVLRPLRICRR